MSRPKKTMNLLSKIEGYEGFCVRCKEWTSDGVEPDAEGYECPDCGEPAVMGAENALISGYVTGPMEDAL